MRRALSFILFVFEPFLAATLLLRVGPTLFDRDVLTLIAFIARIVLALASVSAAIGLRAGRPYAPGLALGVLVSSALFALIQYFTRALPTSLAPDIAPIVTTLIVVHHTAWMIALLRSQASARKRSGALGPRERPS